MDEKKYYQMPQDAVRQEVNQGMEPLTASQVEERQKKYGPNELVEGEKKSTLRIFLEQFSDFLVIILIISAVISLFLGEAESAIVILVVITMNAILGTVQTIKAEQSPEQSEKTLSTHGEGSARRRGDGNPEPEVTIGDEVYLEAGDYIPADGRILENASMKVDESALTGESLGVEKTQDALEGDLALGDRTNMVYSGSFVTYGRGKFLVTAIGMDTEVGKIAKLLKTTSEKKTPLQVNLDQFGKKLSIMILVLCGLLFALQVFRGGNVAGCVPLRSRSGSGSDPGGAEFYCDYCSGFRNPEDGKGRRDYPQASGSGRMGSVSVICSDKTGTLTQNKMTVEHYFMDGQNVDAAQADPMNPLHKQMMRLSILCNDSTNTDGEEIGDPTETAMINLADKLGVPAQRVRNAYPRLSEVPFDSDRKLMSTLHNLKDGYTMITKGAVDVLADRVTTIQREGAVCPITEEDRREIAKWNEEYSREGLRVLGVAYKKLDQEKELTLDDEQDLTFFGLIAMMDPPRQESADAVQKCIGAGIRPVMITGDHKVTAAAIAKRIGILKNMDEACEGSQIDSMSDEELKNFVEKISVYARVSPEHKIRIVRAWQDKGNIVAMTGDGVNDAPALKQADIGVAMGITGSEVSKDAASMVLTDDNFATIVKAVENGRNVYANIKNSIQFLLSGNFAAILMVLFASLASLPVPFAPVHLLFINLLTDSLPAIALGLEPHNPLVMKEKPRPMNESILTKPFLTSVGVEGLCNRYTYRLDIPMEIRFWRRPWRLLPCVCPVWCMDITVNPRTRPCLHVNFSTTNSCRERLSSDSCF